MKLKTQRRLVNSATLLTLATGCGVCVYLVATPVESLDSSTLQLNSSAIGKSVNDSTEESRAINVQHAAWKRELRNPLYDPPPPPPKEKPKPRPITVVLTGTILEGTNSQAFLKDGRGNMLLKRVGDPVSDDPRDGTIETIEADAITIRREDGVHKLAVERQN